MAAADKETHASALRLRSYQDESYLHGFLGTVDDLQKAGVLQDVVLEVEGRRFPCHRLVLSAASPYFRAMFTSDMAESRQKTVVLQGLDAGMFGEILSYIYSGTLHVSLDKVQPLYQAADLLQLDYVRDTCSSYMAINVERSTCVDLYKFADDFSVYIVQKQCLQWIARHFTEFSSDEEFYSLSAKKVTEIISHDELDVKEETTVWEAVVRWVQHSREERLHHLPKILPHIRFNLLTSDDTAAILKHPLVREDPGSSEVIRNNVVQKENTNLKPRLGMTTEMAILCLSSRFRKPKELLFMNPHEGKFIRCRYNLEDMPEFNAMTVTSDNDIFILQVEESEEENKQSLLKYNHAHNVWEQTGVSPIYNGPEDDLYCHWHYLYEVDHILYYILCDPYKDRPLVQVRRYNQNTDQWQECSQLQLLDAVHVSHSAVLPCGPNLYFLSTTETTGTMEVHGYDPSEDKWCKRTTPMISLEICTAVAMETEIFCTDNDFTQTMVYDTESDCWQKLQGWPTPGIFAVHGLPIMFVLENQLHILLRCSSNAQVIYLIYVYDRSADTWRELKANLPNMEYHAWDFSPVARMYLPYLKGT
ncbi:kelch repeat and BTB domain-containing protein 12-like [Branchiostoma floridae x Branchiostoma japonicum]